MENLFEPISTNKGLFIKPQGNKKTGDKNSEQADLKPDSIDGGTDPTNRVITGQFMKPGLVHSRPSTPKILDAISLGKSKLTQFASPGRTPTRSLVSPDEATRQARRVSEPLEGDTQKSSVVDFLETVHIPVNTVEVINTLHIPKVPSSTKDKKPVRRGAKVEASVGTSLAEKSASSVSSLKPVMNGQQRIIYFVLLGLWFCALIFFWSWWLRPEHMVTVAGIVVNNLVLAWSTLLPGYYFFFLGRMRQPDSSLSLPEGRVAMVVTKAPSEPWSVVEKTLTAMLAQRFPRLFDVWLADEDPSEEIFQWCLAHGVFVSCRKGMPGYDNESWPRRRKSKEGNLSYFYDTSGYRLYDFVAQLDADHVPERDYLVNMMLSFRDPTIGYVAAPSICDANASTSWLARARLYFEASMHGVVQAGYSSGFAPFCIGSHYAVRTEALKEIGGLGPELAEDHSTSFLFNAHGWKGAFAFNAFAHGDGAECLADSVTQEFQWSRSLMKLLLTVTPRYWKKLPFKLKVQFLFAQLWYSFSCGNMLVVSVLPLIALATQTPLANANYPDFVVHFTGAMLVCILTVYWTKLEGWLRPRNAKVLSWESWFFPMVCWPWTLLGISHAIVSTLLKKELSFRVTPKGRTEVKPLPGRVLLPYTIIVVVSFLCSFFLPGGNAHTYHWFVSMSIWSYALLIWIGVLGHVYDNRKHGMRQIVSSIKGSFWQLLCASACVFIDLQTHFGEILTLFVSH